MKLFASALISAVILISCTPDPEFTPPPIQQPAALKALRMTEPGLARELVYDNSGRLTSLVTITDIAGGGEWRATTEYVYDAQGRITESTTDTGWRLVYFYTEDRITATDEYVSGVLSQKHSFTYDAKGRLVGSITTQNIPEEGGVIPVAGAGYQYDDRDNLIVNELYYYTPMGAESKLLTRFVYSDYDDKINSDEYFDLIAYNPILNIRKNNPGRVEITNASGVLTITEVYSYEYHSRGYVTRKTTQSTSFGGPAATAVVEYEFEE